MVDHSKLELFNKTLQGQTQGTLVGNWWEEREMRMVTDIGRTVQSVHIPKVRQELFSLPPDEIKLDDQNIDIKTADRIFCDRKYQEFTNTSSTYGQQKNKADQFEKLGKKTQLFLKQNLQQIENEQNDKLLQKQALNSQRFFETTQNAYHGMKSNTGTIGRMIMRDQNNNQIQQQKDDPYYAEMGRIQRPVLSQNIHVEKQQDYIDHVQATYYEEKKGSGNFYKSQGDNFNLNNKFIKDYSHYTHLKL